MANGRLSAKLNDLEGRSRRLNILIVGIKEGDEKSRPTKFISKLIPLVTWSGQLQQTSEGVQSAA